MLSDHIKINWEVNNIEMPRKFIFIYKLNNTLLNNPWIKEEITKEILKYVN